ncbi:uncharacterized protein LOC100908519 [Galendromus occidentalis]|uniref:Uncharacterized protein LOC100908519 n=1 Tax=Galendromus occidentalis TaxID=34638 RepID=A0AAJ7L4S2_9ACAR|nr:uncharacterized protein LOC100908519 [Galendromus occidentalis]
MKYLPALLSLLLIGTTDADTERNTVTCVMDLIKSYYVNFYMDFIKTCVDLGSKTAGNLFYTDLNSEFSSFEENLRNLTESTVLTREECSKKGWLMRNICQLNENKNFLLRVNLAHARFLRRVATKFFELPGSLSALVFKFISLQIRMFHVHAREAVACLRRTSVRNVHCRLLAEHQGYQ